MNQMRSQNETKLYEMYLLLCYLGSKTT